MLRLLSLPLSLPSLGLALGVAGCGSLPTGAPTGTSLGIPSAVRDACIPRYVLTEADVQAFIFGVETDRENGFTKTEELLILLQACGTIPGCYTCGSAVVEYIYSN